jgi:hypothetical protein
MAVYVDPLFETSGLSKNWPYPEACHLMADSIEELERMASILKLKTKWRQVTSIVHYDLTRNKRYQAVKNGAIEVDAGFRPESYKEQIERLK